jgi:hypothetical protein
VRRTLASPSLRSILLDWHLISVDEQAIALALAFVAYAAVAKSRRVATLARGGEFFVHVICLEV